MRLDGKTAIITGGGGAMGRAQAKLFAKEGACVCVADFNLKMAQKVVDDIVAADGKAIAGDLDVRNPDQWLDTITLTEETFCSVDILCNNAGANFRVGFDNQTLEQWHTIIDTGLTGAFLGIKAVIPAMRRSGGGVILNMGSLASIRPGGSPAYATQKMGLVGLTRVAAAYYAKDNIRCVIVSPGHVDTPFIRNNSSYSPNDDTTSIDNPENYRRRVEATPLGRLMVPEDVAKTFLFVASDEGSMITGSMITVDGGAAL